MTKNSKFIIFGLGQCLIQLWAPSTCIHVYGMPILGNGPDIQTYESLYDPYDLNDGYIDDEGTYCCNGRLAFNTSQAGLIKLIKEKLTVHT